MPFLSDECGLHIDNSYVYPLYKHCINAEHPTMAVIGYVFFSAITHMIEIQVTFLFHSTIIAEKKLLKNQKFIENSWIF